MKKKIHLGKKTLMSLEFQITSILTSLTRTEVSIDRMKPVRLDTGYFIHVRYHTLAEPEIQRSRYFAHQKIGDCCDVWLESPDHRRPGMDNDAA
jgi:hypothetical protein